MSEHIRSPKRRRAWQVLHDALQQAGVFACLTNAEQVLVWVDGVGVLRLVAGVSGLLWRTTDWGKEPRLYSAWASPQQLVRAMLPELVRDVRGQLVFDFGGAA
jgi:hypothetical protein